MRRARSERGRLWNASMEKVLSARCRPRSEPLRRLRLALPWMSPRPFLPPSSGSARPLVKIPTDCGVNYSWRLSRSAASKMYCEKELIVCSREAEANTNFIFIQAAAVPPYASTSVMGPEAAFAMAWHSSHHHHRQAARRSCATPVDLMPLAMLLAPPPPPPPPD